jgi:hypothetical protein
MEFRQAEHMIILASRKFGCHRSASPKMIFRGEFISTHGGQPPFCAGSTCSTESVSSSFALIGMLLLPIVRPKEVELAFATEGDTLRHRLMLAIVAALISSEPAELRRVN